MSGSILSKNTVIRKCNRCKTEGEQEAWFKYNYVFGTIGSWSCRNCFSKDVSIEKVIEPGETE